MNTNQTRNRFTINVGIVDDDAKEALHLASLLADAFARQAQFSPPTTIDFEVKVTVLFPDVNEYAETFVDRVIKCFQCEADFETQLSHPAILEQYKPFVTERVCGQNLHVLLLDFLLNELNMQGQGTKPTGEDLLRELAIFRPNVIRCLLTNSKPSEFPNPDVFETSFEKLQLRQRASCDRIASEIISRVQKRMRTPFWTGLINYVGTPKIVMHAMALAEGRSLSTLTEDFQEFYGSRLFQAEASLTLPPLDSIFQSTGSLKDSAELFAESFGADACLFSTNGTSTANKILTQILVAENDIILLDRNCHISHHYAYALQRARPIFLDPIFDSETAIPGNVTPDVVKHHLESLLSSVLLVRSKIERKDLPALIVITNCSFDGYMVKPTDIITAVYEVLQKFNIVDLFDRIAFLFDEAWFGFGRFHPKLIPFTAMGSIACAERSSPVFTKARIYATMSVHKTMSALRQASVILTKDPSIRPAGRARLLHDMKTRQAVSCHTTTSPHAAILSSLDIARRQMDFEGTHGICEAISCAQTFMNLFEKEVQTGECLGDYFRLVPQDRLLDVGLTSDPTKLTVLLTKALSGVRVKKYLWQKYGVQINKFGSRSILLMFMMGANDSLAANLIGKFKDYARVLSQEGIEGDDFPDMAKLPALSKIEGIDSFIDQAGLVCSYPNAVAQGHRIGSFECLFGHLSAACELLEVEALKDLSLTKKLVSSGFVTPYPPGFPILVPGQVINTRIAELLEELADSEVHGLITGKGQRRLVSVIDIDKVSG